MQTRDNYPNFWNAVLILFLLIGLQMMISIIVFDLGYEFDLGDPKATTVITILSCTIVFSVLMAYKKIHYTDILNSSKNSVRSMLIVFTVPLLLTMGGAVFWISDITNIVMVVYPMDADEYKMFSRLVGGGVISIFAVCIVAPFIEEVLFRGIFLKSFLYNYSTTRAIVLSTLLFAFVHLNIYQIPAAVILGGFLGWLYVRCQSIWPCIFGHAFYNAYAMLYWFFIDGKLETDAAMDIRFNSVGVNMLSILTSAIGVFLLLKIVTPKKIYTRG